MPNKLIELGEILEERHREQSPRLEERYMGGVLSDSDKIKEARRVATSLFVRLGKIPPSEVDEDGILKHDHVLPISTFFGVYKKGEDLQATTRLLWGDSITVDQLRLPIDSIDDDKRVFLESQRPGSIAEIGSLAKSDKSVSGVAVLKLLRYIWNFAGEKNIEIFVCGLEPKLYPRFREQFGDALIRLSESNVTFPGIKGEQVPLMIDVRRAVENQDSSEHSSVLQRKVRRMMGTFIMRDMMRMMLSASEAKGKNQSVS